MAEHRFEHRKEAEQQSAQRQQEEEKGLQFAAAEEAIRHDRESAAPPVEIAERLNQSIANEPKKETGFWARIMGRK